LIAAALARWEQAATEEPIRHLDLIRDPRDRLRVLATATLTHREGGLRDAALSASADHPLVKPVLRRVTARRMAFIANVYTELGSANAATCSASASRCAQRASTSLRVRCSSAPSFQRRRVRGHSHLLLCLAPAGAEVGHLGSERLLDEGCFDRECLDLRIRR
jgi:hypothetical protein